MNTIPRFFVRVGVLFAATFLAWAQNPDSKSDKAKTVTGCLRKGFEAGEYSITGDDGKIYTLRSSSVKLGDHLGHKVTITGRTNADAKSDKQKGPEAGNLDVSDLKMVSTSCQ